MRTIQYIFFFSVCSIYTKAQSFKWEPVTTKEVASAYKKACEWFINTPSYFFKIKYSSYGDGITSVPKETSEGYYKRVSNNYITEGVGVKTIQNQRLRLILDTNDKVVTVMNPGDLNIGISTIEEVENLLLNIKSLKKSKLSDGICYKLSFNKNDLFEAYEFLVDEKGILKSLVYYYSEQVEKEDGDWRFGGVNEYKVKPRLEIRFFGYEVPAKYKESEFSERAIMKYEKNDVNLTSIYEGYRLLDYRTSVKH